MQIQPRWIRLKDCPAYLGMDKNRFNDEVRPYLFEIPIGSQGIAFDRLDLDQWAEAYKRRNGRPGAALKGGNEWAKGRSQVSFSGQAFGMSKKGSVQGELERALERVMSKKRSGT